MSKALIAARPGLCSILFALFASTLGANGAAAQAEDDRMRLFRYYFVHVAIDVCEIDISSARQKRFDAATDTLEQRTGATKAEMDATFKQIKTGASENPRGFCETYRPVARQTLAEFD